MKKDKTKVQKLLFKNVTQYDLKNYEHFLEFHTKKYGIYDIIYTFGMSILLIYCVILNITQKNLPLTLFFLFLLLVFIALTIYLPKRRRRKTEKNIDKYPNSYCTFSFYELYFKSENQVLYYFKIYKIFETKDYFYFYLNRDYALMLSKNGFQVGNVDDFRNFIKQKCLFKYHKQ